MHPGASAALLNAPDYARAVRGSQVKSRVFYCIFKLEREECRMRKDFTFVFRTPEMTRHKIEPSTRVRCAFDTVRLSYAHETESGHHERFHPRIERELFEGSAGSGSRGAAGDSRDAGALAR